MSLKPSVKRPATLFILLLTGYAQVFADLHQANCSSSPIRRTGGFEYLQSSVIKSSGIESVSVLEEEENERILKHQAKDNSLSPFTVAHPADNFLQGIRNNSFFYSHLFSIPFFRRTCCAFRVLRL